ncbi:histamine H2 receptor-like [Oculina patagonica]
MTNRTVFVSEVSEEKLSPTVIVQFVLLAIIFLVAVTGNGLVCFVVYHFKHLRTIPNILIVNLSLIDLINSLVNMPLFAGFYIFKADVFSGKWISYVFSSLHNYMLYLNVLTLVVLMADRYGAIKFKMRYHAWKTKTKVYQAIAAIWVTGTALIIFLGFRKNRVLSEYEGLPLMEYRRILYRAEGWKVALGLFGTPLIIIAVLGALIWRSVKASRKRLKAITTGDDCSPQGKAMLKLIREKEIRTMQNIIIIVVTYFVCFVPAMAHGVCVRREINLPWLEYFAFFFTYFTSACNPVVYSLRTCRFRQVIKKLLKPKRKRDRVLPVVNSTVRTNESNL